MSLKYNEDVNSSLAIVDAKKVIEAAESYIKKIDKWRIKQFDEELDKYYPPYLKSYKKKKSVRFINFCLRWFAWGRLRGFQFEPLTREEFGEHHSDMYGARMSREIMSESWRQRAKALIKLAKASDNGRVFLDAQDASFLVP